MKINDAIKNILKETLPDSINNIHIRYDLRESKSLTYCDQKDYIITIMPVEIDCENVAASTRVLSHIFLLILTNHLWHINIYEGELKKCQ